MKLNKRTDDKPVKQEYTGKLSESDEVPWAEDETINITEEEIQDMADKGEKQLKSFTGGPKEWKEFSMTEKLIETSNELEKLKGIVRAYINLGEGYRRDELEAEIKALI